MSTVSIGDYIVLRHDYGLPDKYAEYRKNAELVEEFDLDRSEGTLCFVGIQKDSQMPFLVVAQRYVPSGFGFNPGVQLVEETGVLFIGAGERMLAYDVRHTVRLWEDTADQGFLRWSRQGSTLVMSAELELAAWNLDGRKLWSPRWAAGELLGPFDGEPSRLPRCHASLEMEYVLESRSKQRGLTLSSSRPDHAINGDTVRCVDLGDAPRHLVERNVDGTGDVAGGVLLGSAHVDHSGCGFRFAPRVEFSCADAGSLGRLGIFGERRGSQQGAKNDCNESPNHHLTPPLL